MSNVSTGVLELLIEALNANTAALNANAGTSAADAKSTSAAGNKKSTATNSKKTEAAANKPTNSKADAVGAVVALKDTVGLDAAKALLGKYGYKKAADITDENIDAIFAEATAQLEAAKDEGDGDDDSI